MSDTAITEEDLQRMAAEMVKAIADLDCPECCDCGVVYQYVERSCELYKEEWEWACLANSLVYYRHRRSSHI